MAQASDEGLFSIPFFISTMVLWCILIQQNYSEDGLVNGCDPILVVDRCGPEQFPSYVRHLSFDNTLFISFIALTKNQINLNLVEVYNI